MDDNTFEPDTNLRGCEHMIRAYFEDKGIKDEEKVVEEPADEVMEEEEEPSVGDYEVS